MHGQPHIRFTDRYEWIQKWLRKWRISLHRGPVGEPWRGVLDRGPWEKGEFWFIRSPFLWGIREICKNWLRKQAILSLGSLGDLEGWLVLPGTLRDRWRKALEKERLSLWRFWNQEGGHFYRVSWRICKRKALETSISLHRGSVGETGGGVL